MRLPAVVLCLVIAGAGAASCGGPCKTRSDCDTGEYCEFTSGECRQGCTSNADCGYMSSCDPIKGQCTLPGSTFPRDGGTGTSTVTDAG